MNRNNTLLYIIYGTILLILSGGLAGCSSSKQMARDPIYDAGKAVSKAKPTINNNSKPRAKVAEVKKNSTYRKLNSTSKAVVDEAFAWLGTPYRYGGENKGGVDCSGLVMEVYKKSTGVKLPRSSAQQHDFCNKIGEKELMPGDLVFFTSKTARGKVAHVGIYIGDNLMVHSSSSRGVVISSLGEKYFTTYYHSAGRVGEFVNAPKTATEKPVKRELPKNIVIKEISVDELDDILSQKADSIFTGLFD